VEFNKELFEKTGIMEFPNAIPEKICDEVIEEFYKHSKEHFQGKVGGGIRTQVKYSTDWWIDKNPIKEPVFCCLWEVMEKVMKCYPSLNRFRLMFSGFQLQKSLKNKGYFKWHSDNDESNLDKARLLAVLIYLNDVEEGGETEFFYQKHKIKPTKGKIVIFPSVWTYYHRGCKPISNDKYLVTSFGFIERHFDRDNDKLLRERGELI